MSEQGVYFSPPPSRALKFGSDSDRELYMANIVFYRGLPGKSAYEYYLETTIDNPPLTEAEFGNLFNQMREKIEILRSDVDELKNTPSDVIYKETYYEFPSLGKKDTIYVDTTASLSYRWDDAELKYYPINELRIDIINGGN
ncbi:MAG: hypothetical protein CVU12_02090 [Bacteroidetes bacterium HGW-Bacteroidetes-7]|jgi:hypothetical protein|nr:MAG: hypothetical protein CVU12_02090 [Bacteroidetes bacterium HGW-Bacteroidetes-7]